MSPPIVVLTAPDAGPASAYATWLASALGVPPHALAAAPVPDGTGEPLLPYQLPAGLATALAEHDPLLLVVARPAAAHPDWLLGQVQALLQAATPPVLVVPAPLAGRVPPLRIALAADGRPFSLLHGRRAMHALLAMLPVQLTVVHAHLPQPTFGADDALQSVLACGLATRYLRAGVLEVAADTPATGILLAAAQAQADLLAVIVRPQGLLSPDFATSTTAALLRHSPVPVLLLQAA